MRKHTPRNRQYAGKRLSPQQVQSLLIGPELAFVMLKGQGANLAQVQSLLGLFNLGSVMTAVPRHAEANRLILLAQACVAAIKPDEDGDYHLPVVEQAAVSASLRRIHDLIRMSDMAVVARALEYINRSFDGGTRATIVPWNRLGPDEFSTDQDAD